jgi:hypothetical protein
MIKITKYKISPLNKIKYKVQIYENKNKDIGKIVSIKELTGLIVTSTILD